MTYYWYYFEDGYACCVKGKGAFPKDDAQF